jgi:hypothetical protein
LGTAPSPCILLGIKPDRPVHFLRVAKWPDPPSPSPLSCCDGSLPWSWSSRPLIRRTILISVGRRARRGKSTAQGPGGYPVVDPLRDLSQGDLAFHWTHRRLAGRHPASHLDLGTIDFGLLNLMQPAIMTWVLLFAVATILAVGIYWFYIRRRITSQADIDDVDEW